MDNHQITIDTYNKVAQAYEEKFMQMDLYDDTYDRFCQLIETENADIFEIACGPGNITKYLLHTRPDFKITATDTSLNMLELARKNVPDAYFSLMDCREINRLTKQFDALMCGFCMPYLSKEDCSALIKDASGILKRGGILYFSTMEGDYASSGFETTSFSGDEKVYVYYHQAVFLTEKLHENGFEIVDLQRKKYPEPDGTFLIDMIFIAKKK